MADRPAGVVEEEDDLLETDAGLGFRVWGLGFRV